MTSKIATKQNKGTKKKKKEKKRGEKYVSLSSSSGQLNSVLIQMALVKLNGQQN